MSVPGTILSSLRRLRGAALRWRVTQCRCSIELLTFLLYGKQINYCCSICLSLVPKCACCSGLRAVYRLMADAQKAARVRSLLSAYYTAGVDGAPGGQTRSAVSIDSAAFDTEVYVSNLVRQVLETLTALLSPSCAPPS